jgi:hypothetical protein
VHRLARRLCHHGIASICKSILMYQLYLESFLGAELSWDSATNALFPSWRGRGTEVSPAYLCQSNIVETEIAESCKTVRQLNPVWRLDNEFYSSRTVLFWITRCLRIRHFSAQVNGQEVAMNHLLASRHSRAKIS